ncbi:unnamed protein product [Rotaria magnacalcarata]|uniref:small monomeric GTPase n=1 Tax=Rotaria magnacalcarata TaxID=392030 RepID=A0A816RUY6_9BILA|nr:unnamed protein product [Rotaria magnacalcarata]
MAQANFINEVVGAKDDLEELEEIEKQPEKQFDDACEAVVMAKEEGKTAEEIKHLTNIKADQKFKVCLAALVAENASDKRDDIMKKDLRLQNKIGELAIVGLDNAGKTTLLHTLKDDQVAQHTSTLYPTSEELIMGNIKFTAFDLGGGHAQAGSVWKDYFPAVDSIVFLVDATDRRSFAKAKAELDSLLTDEHIAGSPIVILGTKSDLPEAVTEEKRRQVLDIFSGTVDSTNVNDRPMELFMCNLKEQASFGCAFRWLGRFLKDKVTII